MPYADNVSGSTEVWAWYGAFQARPEFTEEIYSQTDQLDEDCREGLHLYGFKEWV